MTFSYNLIFLAASFTVAVAGIYVALEFALSIVRSGERTHRNLIDGSLILGIGIWCVHSNGLLALDTSQTVNYELGYILLSLLIAILGGGVIFGFVSSERSNLKWQLIAVLCLTLTSVSSHFMLAMSLSGSIVIALLSKQFSSFLLCGSLVLAGLSMQFINKETKYDLGRFRRLLCVVFIGLAVVSSQYFLVDMAPTLLGSSSIGYLTVNHSVLSTGVGISSILILAIACNQLIKKPIISVVGMILVVFSAEFSIKMISDGLSPATDSIITSLINASIFTVLLIPLWRRIHLDSAALDQAKRRAETILASIGDGVLVTDPGGEIEYMNPIAETLTGWESDSVQGKKLSAAFNVWDNETRLPVKDPIDHCVQEKINNKHNVQAILQHRSRQSHPIEVSASPIQVGKKNEGNILVFRDVTERHRSERESRQDLEGRKAHNKLLQIRATEISMDALLRESLDIVLSLPWLNVTAGGIFLSDPKHKELNLKVHKNLAPEVQKLCSKVKSAKCLCGQAAASKEIVFSSRVDDRHDITYDNMPAHGNYSVPIMLDGNLLGMMVLYLKHNHRQRAHESGFLESMMNAVAILIDLKRKSRKIQNLAFYDKLTKLANRAFLLQHFRQVVKQAKQDNKQFGVLFLDLDRFKTINDSLGHHFGDEILKQVATRLKACVRKDDFVARLGGDEFVILLSGARQPGSSSHKSATRISEKVLKSIRETFYIEGHDLNIGTSIGAAVFPDDGDTLETLLQNADAAMYHAKGKGRNNYQFYSETMNDSLLRRLELENALHKAGEKGDLKVCYQPQVDLVSNDIISAEALLRWNDPKWGDISPVEFISVAEESDLIIQLGEWVLGQVCQQLAKWKKTAQFPMLKSVAINASLKEMQRAGFAEGVEAVLKRYRIEPSVIEFEITESALADDSEAIHDNISKLQRLGVKLALDDFGTGYSSLGRLKEFPVDVIKIDRSFIQDMTTNKDDAAIAKAIVAMAHGLNIRVLAEGVENIHQAQDLADYGCDMFQGFYCAPALDGDAFEKFFQNRKVMADKNKLIESTNSDAVSGL